MTDKEIQALKEAGIPVDGYSLAQFEADIQAVQPRFFDVWVIPPLMMWFAAKAKGMPRNARRILFAGGIYAMYRNYSRYKEAAVKLSAAAASAEGAGGTSRTATDQTAGACYSE